MTTTSFFIPVIAHNMKGFDAHLILKGYERNVAQRGSQINVIPSNTEKIHRISDRQIALSRQSAISERFTRQSRQYAATRCL